ncbi:hypothetical protein EYC59_01010 [Candidatus Saccharibacteria bacterium]|nr:MAG: hypothetical protein EYC59_01010 [Candidatus Saccharibacteria bacterium]
MSGIAIAYIVLGIVLLLFGARLMKVALTLYGALLGLWLTGWLTDKLHMGSGVGALVILAGAALGAILFYGFYRFIIKVAVAFFVGSFAYGVFIALGTGVVAGFIFAALTAVLAYLLMHRFDIVTKVFIVISSMQGATALITGIYMASHGGTSVHEIVAGNPYIALQNSEWGFLAALIIALMGISVQLKHTKNSAG